MPIVWRDALSVGNDLIDADHRHLLSLINTVEDILIANRRCADLQEAIESLWNYTNFHFMREEQIMLRLQYAKYDDHKQAHGKLIEQLKQVTKPIQDSGRETASTTSSLPQEMRDKVVELLRNWLVDHIIKEDFKLRPLLVGYGRSFSAET